jgi:HAD superfamily hydrolase (TIGR01509 family)
MSKSPKAVIFDMDGVLIDAREWHYVALNETLSIFGYEISREEHISRFDGLSTATKLEILSNERGLPRYLHKSINRIKQDRTLRLAAQYCYPNMSHQVLISRLITMGIKVGVVTNSVRQTTEFMLTYAGVINHLSVVITNQDVDSPKPAPDGYLEAMRRLDVRPSETIVVEDSEYGIQAAKASGANVVIKTEDSELGLDLLAPYITGLI